MTDTLAAYKNVALQLTYDWLDGEAERLGGFYPRRVRDTFPQQEAAARAWAADQATVPPQGLALLSGIAAFKGETVAVLVPKIIAKANAFTGIGARLAGVAADAANAIAAATTHEEVDAARDAAVQAFSAATA